MRNTYKDHTPGAELPSDVPKQLQVGSRVTARHPLTRQLHDGDVLTVNYNSYRWIFLINCLDRDFALFKFSEFAL